MKIANVLYFRYMKITKNRSGFPLSTSLDIIGDKWSLVVVRDLFLGRDTFSKVMTKNHEKIASNILSDRLKKMKAKGILDYRICPVDKKVKSYTLGCGETTTNLFISGLLINNCIAINEPNEKPEIQH